MVPSSSPCSPVYKILTPQEWDEAQQSRSLRTPLDEADGFVHLSGATQLAGTLQRYFGDAARVVLVEICQDSLSADLRWEAPVPAGGRPGLFPHLYRDLRLDDVVQTWLVGRGGFRLPLDVVDQAERDAT